MAEKKYIEREAAIDACFNGWNNNAHDCAENIRKIPAADVLPRDEGIKLGAEIAAMHGATPEQQQLEEAYLKGVEYGMTRRDVRPVVLCRDCIHYEMGACLKIYDDGAANKDAWQERKPDDFCSYSEKREES